MTMPLQALGTSVVGKVKTALNRDSHSYSETSNEEDEQFLSTSGQSGRRNYDSEKLSNGEEYMGHASRRFWNCSTIIAVVSSILAAVLLFTVASLYDRKSTINYIPAITPDLQPGAWPMIEGGTETIVDCGSTPAEAQAKGCVWDLMSFSWTHPACYNKNISDEFLEKYGPFTFHANINKKPGYKLTQEELPYIRSVTPETKVPMVWAEAMSGHLVTNEGIGMGHTNHCVTVFLDPDRDPFSKITTRVELLFGKCVKIRVVN
ncbi:hypothetical protein DSL72_007955 [Monilinia vaccinii-corymbosi]|uniref:Uncharacterized protein n=1 Tax=Monilinia vaccinii-corymbosi TaxID=61207 RepID=A0A8A3PJD7_9HELO|nr:hypothetical protein DSL72_007955 [Monilinia vaccinii-corymbosi]